MTDALYVLHRNHLGKSRYQPRLANGQRLWMATEFDPVLPGEVTRIWWDLNDWFKPVLYRSCRRAERVARRGQRRRERALRNEFHEVKEEA